MKKIIRFTALLLLTVSALHADLKTDLSNINSSIVELNTSIAGLNLTSDALCAPLISINRQASAIVDAIALVNANLAAPLALDSDTLLLTETLFVNIASLSNESYLLSTDITLLQTTTDALTLKDGITAMLQLSSDIGKMADRIGEMADNILIMSDNIGLMADRILVTQMIQNENIALTQNSILQTQTNTLALVSVAETASYDLSLETLVSQGELLVAQMSLVALNPWNMANALEDVRNDMQAYRLQVEQFKAQLSSDTLQNTLYINTQSMDALMNLSLIMSSMGTVLDGYGVMINASKVMTRETTLLDAMGSMLALSADIGKMSNSILEMADQILLMADNIGMEANQILLTQQLQSTNIVAAQTSILAAQQLALGIIAASN
jgi:hypothetical protein